MEQQGLRQRVKTKPEAVPLLQEEKEKQTSSRTPRALPKGHVLVAILLTVIALWTRLFKIQWSSRVIWYKV